MSSFSKSAGVCIRGVSHTEGFAYLWTLLAVALMGVGLTVVGQVYSTSLHREQEQELLFIGREFREALGRYHAVRMTGGREDYPSALEELLKDPRSPAALRHLRKLYIDPMTGKAEWGVVRLDGKIVGIHSLSSQLPLKQDGFEVAEASFKKAQHYSDWIFTYPADLLLKEERQGQVGRQVTPRPKDTK